MLCSDTPYHQFPLYPKPEIQRTRIDLNYLKILSTTGLKMEELDFFHPIPMESIQKTKESMQLLGIIHKDGTISPRGSKLASFSIDVNSGVMLLEAEKL